MVAYAGPDLYTSREVTAADEFLHITGKGTMTVMLDFYLSYWGRELFDMIDLDTGALSYYQEEGTERTWPQT